MQTLSIQSIFSVDERHTEVSHTPGMGVHVLDDISPIFIDGVVHLEGKRRVQRIAVVWVHQQAVHHAQNGRDGGVGSPRAIQDGMAYLTSARNKRMVRS